MFLQSINQPAAKPLNKNLLVKNQQSFSWSCISSYLNNNNPATKS